MSTPQDQSKPRPRRRRRWALALIAILVGAAAYAAIPRHADLTRFDPQGMAREETAMWRHYYEKRYFALLADLYGVARDEYGFSPLDGLRIAVSAARAAKEFQPSISRAEAQAALPELNTYFGVLASAAPISVDVPEAARIELDWWQARREDVPPQQYGLTIARVTTLLYGTDGEDIRRAGVLRALAMEYRDTHAERMTEADWSEIDNQLRTAYGLLKKGLSRPPG